MLGMWDIAHVRCLDRRLFEIWEDQDVGYLRCGVVWDVGCLGCEMFEMWDVECIIFSRILDVNLENVIKTLYQMTLCSFLI